MIHFGMIQETEGKEWNEFRLIEINYLKINYQKLLVVYKLYKYIPY